MHFDKGLRQMRAELRAQARARHGVPLVAHAAGVEPQCKRRRGFCVERGFLRRDQPRLAVGREEAAVGEKPPLAATLAARAETLRDEDAYVKYCSFRVRKGDNVQRLARAVGSKPETLLAMNGLDESDRIREGQSIYLPVRARELVSLLRKGADDEIYYAVRKGDTLYSIAKKNGLTVAELRDLNDLSKKASLKKGQKLRVTAPRTLAAGGM